MLEVPSNIIFECKFGSRLYGLATDASDLDIKGVFIPTREDIILQRCKDSMKSSTSVDGTKNTSEDIDTEYISLQSFCEKLSKGLTFAVDMIHCPTDRSITYKEPWNYLRDNRKRFYTKTMLRECISYVRSQIVKYGITGTRVDSIVNIARILHRNGSKRIIDVIPELSQFVNTGGDMINIFGKSFSLTIKCSDAYSSIQKIVDTSCQKYILAMNDEGINYKDVSHAFRAIYQMNSILDVGDIIYPFVGNEYDTLMKVKYHGERLSWKNFLRPTLEMMIENLEKRISVSNLPEIVDHEWVDHFVYCSYYRAVQPDFWS